MVQDFCGETSWQVLLIDEQQSLQSPVSKGLGRLAEIADMPLPRIETSDTFSRALDLMMTGAFDAVILDPAILSPETGMEKLEQLHAVNVDTVILIVSDIVYPPWVAASARLNIKGIWPGADRDSDMFSAQLSLAVMNARQEKMLRLENSRYKRNIHNLGDAYFELDLSGHHTYVNKAAERHTGRSAQDLIGMNSKQIIPGQRHKKTSEIYRRMYEGNIKNAVYDNEIIRPDGSRFYTEVSVSLMKDEYGKPVGYYGISRDVTEKKQAQAALEKSEEKYKNILDNIDDGYFEVDLKGRMQFFNHAMARMLGYDEKELKGMHYKALMDPENARKTFESFNRIYRNGRSNLFLQYEMTKKDGSKAYHEVIASLMLDRNGTPTGFRAVTRDLTETKKAQKALRQSEARYRNILSSIEDGYFEVDLKGKMTFCNDALAEIIGYPKDQILGMSHGRYMADKYTQKVSRAYNKVFCTGRPQKDLQYEIRLKDGSVKSVESSVTLIRDTDGTAVGFRGIARDISDRKRTETELKTAKKMAEAANQAKSEFLANMSHEIRTPMNGVLGMYNLLMDTPLSEDQYDYVKSGKRSAEALLTVINDILDFSKIEAGKLDIEVIDFDLRKSIDEIVTIPAVQAHKKGLEFVYEIGNEVPSLLMGDPGRLRQVIMNLCTNAIKFTHKGEVLFRVGLEAETPTHASLIFSIEDTGIGISKKDQKKLFSSFEQVDASTTRKYGGTGLGLAISKNLVELMGGRIGLRSTPKEGSKFSFTISLAKQQQAEEKDFDEMESLADKRILVVDDNQTNLNILSRYLEYWGCTCDTAPSGAVALSLMRAVVKAGAPYDLMISDMLMPEMDGAHLGEAVKADPALKSTRMIMLTSQGMRGDAARMKSIGFEAYLNKPVRRSFLYDCLIMVINHQPYYGEKPAAKNGQMITAYRIAEEKRNNLKILLAEDNPVNRKLALALLKKFGWDAHPVENGKLAVRALEKKDYQIVLMDVQMPEMDGISATQWIRNPKSGVKNHDVLIIAMTAHAMKGDRDMCLEAGMNDYISKPINPGKLLDIIEKNVDKFLN